MAASSSPRVLILACAVALAAVATSAAAEDVLTAPRPRILVADESCRCPSVTGSFVVLFDPGRGVLILSGAPFPGGREAGKAAGDPLTIAGEQPWLLDRAGGAAGPVRLWAARYTTRFGTGRGCVGFDKERFSAEGDLFSYARWLAERIYLELPAEERARWPGFRLSDRQVSLSVTRPGFRPIRLRGKEGATLACRFPDSERILLFMPFVLDEASGRVAVRVGASDRAFWVEGEKPNLGVVIASRSEPGALAEPELTIGVEAMEPGTGP